MKGKIKQVTRSNAYKKSKDFILVIIGCVLFAFGDAVFLNKWDIVSGGVSSVGIMIDTFVEPLLGFGIRDIVVAFVQIALWFLGLFLLGKKFSIKTAVAMIAYPGFYALFYRLDVGTHLGLSGLYPPEGVSLSTYALSGSDVSNLIICAIIGGILDGIAVGMAFLGHASTGGFAILSSILAKFTSVKEDVSSFLIDGVLIIMATLLRLSQPSIGICCLGGILSSMACSIAIQFVYINADRYVICDVISDKYQEISDFVIKDLDHSVTLIDAIGGYTGEKRKLLRAIINKSEQMDLERKIAEVDPNAFVSFYKANTINGEGFLPLSMRKKKKGEKKDE